MSFFYFAVVRFYRILNYISLDVAFGAMVCGAFFARILDVKVRPHGLAALGVTVWIIYTMDHLLDAYRIQRDASTERHRFHQRNFKGLLLMVFLAGLANLALLYFIRKPVLLWGAGLCVLVIFYILFQRRLAQFKEVVIALLYAAGVVLPALSQTSEGFSLQNILILASFMLTALTNLILFSWFEFEIDVMDGHTSIVTFLGQMDTRRLIKILFFTQTVMWLILLIFTSGWQESAVLILMNVPLLLLFLEPKRFFKNDAYRFIGDSVFLFPIIYLLWA